MHSKQAAAATDGMPGCCVAEADLCCDVTEIATTDFEDTTNSMGMGKSTTACAFSESVIEGLSNSENHWEATTVLGTVVVMHLLSA